jgi:hypothetical protein
MTISGWNVKATRKTFVAALGTIMVMSAVLMSASVVLAAPPAVAVDLDQCRNGALVPAPGTQGFKQCLTTGSGVSGWVNGNAGASNAHYAEGESISYRARLTNLKVNDVVVLIMGYDVIHNGHDAIDFLTDKNRWQLPETTVAATPDLPCSGVTGCSGSPANIAITAPPTNLQVDPTKTLASGNCQKTGGGATQEPTASYNAVNTAGQENMELFGGTPAASNAFRYVGPTPNLLDTGGDQEQQVQVTFTATSANPVLAWGGHIASRIDWGCTDSIRSASGISGSPYHMRIKSASVNGTPLSLGNQDRSLSAGAVVFLAPTLPTTPSAGGAIGTVLNDTATVTGGSNPTGTVLFNLYGPNDTTCAGTAIYTQTVTLSGGSATTSPGFTTVAAGTYEWTAHYSGDGANLPADSLCGAEEVIIAKSSPTLPTTPSAGGPIGTVLNDTATVTGGSSPTGSIDFKLYGPNDDTCAGTVIYSQTVTLSGGSATTSPGFTTVAAGTYQWTAHYGGDANNNAADSTCGNEAVVIGKNTPAPHSTPVVQIKDTITVTGLTSGATGTVTVKLFSDQCVTQVGSDQTFTVSGSTFSHETTFETVLTGTYYYQVSYDGDANNAGFTSACTAESVGVNITSLS